ncbi:MAG: hypothetical protein JRF38_08635 [Deltaproteobacteria bacterium]|jgi:hypothetical protein|nr:hypothetical protein [Deltaproteobacteria bacterium]
MKPSRLITPVVSIYIIFFVIVGFDSVYSNTYPAEKPASDDQTSSPESWLNQIDMHWGGRLKAIGSATFARDNTIFEPVGTGTYLNLDTDLRINNDTFLEDWGHLETQYEAILVAGRAREKREDLKKIFPDFEGGTIFLGAPLKDDRRFMDLTHTLKDKDSYLVLQRLDRLNFTFKAGWGSVRIGRQAITWGNGLIFNPMDLFNPFAPGDIQRDYKVGDDMVLAQLTLPRSADLQILYVVRRDPDTNNVEADRNSLAGLFHFPAGTTGFDIMATRHYDDYVVGIGSSGIWGGAAWRLDATATFLADGEGHNTRNYLSGVANMDYSWNWWGKNWYGLLEYYYNGLGESDYPGALSNPDITNRLARGELFVLGKHYMSTEIQLELHPLLKIFFTGINNMQDPSGILQPRAVWNVTQNLEMKVGANIFYGDNGNPGSEFGGFIIPGTNIHSRSPNNAYIWFNYYF